LADDLYGQRPCGCPKATDPLQDCQKDCDGIREEALRDAWLNETDPEKLAEEYQKIEDEHFACLMRCTKIYGDGEYF